MQEHYVVRDLEQLKILSNPLRLRVLELLVDQPKTTKQVAHALGEDPLKLYYHVEALERAGLIELVETRMKANLQEKYYRAVAHKFTVDKALFKFRSSEEVTTDLKELVGNLLEALQEEVRNSLIAKDKKEQMTLIATHHHIRTSRKVIEMLGQKVSALLEETEQADEEDGELAYCLGVLFFPLEARTKDGEEGESCWSG